MVPWSWGISRAYSKATVRCALQQARTARDDMKPGSAALHIAGSRGHALGDPIVPRYHWTDKDRSLARRFLRFSRAPATCIGGTAKATTYARSRLLQSSTLQSAASTRRARSTTTAPTHRSGETMQHGLSRDRVGTTQDEWVVRGRSGMDATESLVLPFHCCLRWEQPFPRQKLRFRGRRGLGYWGSTESRSLQAEWPKG